MAKYDKKLGGVLTRCRVITRAQCDEALAWSEKTSCSLMQSLTDLKFCDEETLVTALAEEMNYYPIDLSRIEVSAEALEVLAQEQAKNYRVLPIARMGKLLTLAITNPFDVLILDDVKIITGCEVIPVLTTEMSISSAVERAFKKPIVAKTKSLALKAEEQLCPLFEEQNKYNIRMREFLKKMGYTPGQVTEEVIAHAIVESFSLPFISAVQCKITPDVLSTFPTSKYHEFQFIAFGKIGKTILIVGAGLMTHEMLDELERSSGGKICQFVSTWSDIRKALEEKE